MVLAKDEQEPKLVRPKDLSIYPDESKEKKMCVYICTIILWINIKYVNNLNYSEKENDWQPTLALGSIQKVREEIVNLNQQWSKVKDRVYIFIQTGVSHTECKYIINFFKIIIKYLQIKLYILFGAVTKCVTR